MLIDHCAAGLRNWADALCQWWQVAPALHPARRMIECVELEDRTLLNATPLGAETLVNTATNNTQQLHAESPQAVATNASGNSVVVWTGFGPGASTTESNIYAQRFDASGNKVGSQIQVNSTTGHLDNHPAVEMDSAGNFVVSWTADGDQDGNGLGIFAQAFNSDGTTNGSQFQVNSTSTGDQDYSSIAVDGSGNFLITWSSNGQDGAGWGVYAQQFQSNLSPTGSEFLVNTTTAGDQKFSQVAMNASGSFAITWVTNSGSDAGVRVQRYDSTGAAQGGETQVNQYTTLDQTFPSIAMDATGNFVITFSSQSQDGSGWGIYGQRFNADGTYAAAEFAVNNFTTGDQVYSRVASDTLGDFTIVWQSQAQDNSGWGIYAQQYDSTGTAFGPQFLVNATTSGDQQFASATLQDNTNLTVVWSGNGAGDSDGVFMQRYTDGPDQAPVNTVPGAQLGAIDTPLVFSTANGNAVSIADPDARSNPVQVTLSITNGTLALSGTTNLTFSSGTGSGDTSMVFTGAISDINTALAGLTFTPTSGYTGPAALQITTNDQGFSGNGGPLSATSSVSITVQPMNQAPVNSVPGPQSTNENTSLAFSSSGSNLISVSDADAGSNPVQITLAVSQGTLTLSQTTGLTFATGAGTGDTSMQFQGTLTNVNAALAGMTYTPTTNFYGSDQLQLTTNDLGNTGAGGAQSATSTVALTVNQVNQPPVNSVPGPQSVAENGTLVFSAATGNQISISDPDAGNNLVQVSLVSALGKLSLSQTTGLTFTSGTGTGDYGMQFIGTISNINAALDGMTFSPRSNYSGLAGLGITTNDLGNSGPGGPKSATSGILINVSQVNQPPVNTVPGSQATNQDTPLVFSSAGGNGISINDPDAGSSPVQVTLSATNGTLTLSQTSGLTFSTGTGTANATMVFTGTMTNINSALDGLSFSPTANYSGSAGLQITTNDQGNTGSGGPLSATSSIAITVNHVNQPPVNTVPGGQSTNENTPLVFSSGNGNAISISDPDAGTSPVQVTLNATNGALTLGGTTGLTFSAGTGTGDTSMVFTGTVTNINAALNGLSFAPTTNYSGSAGLQITTNDLGNTGVGGAQSATNSVAITVNHVNQPPVDTVPGGQTTVENTPVVFSTGNGNAISVGDPDAGSSPVKVTLSATNGALTLSQTTGLTFSTGTGTANATMVFTGTIANINAALDGLSFSPTANYSGSAGLQISTNDLGNTGVGGAQTATSSVAITVNHVNQPPVNSVPGGQTTVENTPVVFSNGNGNAISISDPDAGTSPVQVTLNATNGALTLSRTAGLTFSTGTGTGDTTMVFTGTITRINAALNGLSFAPTANYSGSAGLQITTNDLGNTGVGGAQSATDSVAITVNHVNQPPVNTVPGGQTTVENSPLVFSTGNGNAISVGDPDAGSSPLKVTLSATNGTVTLSQTAGLTFSAGTGTGNATMTFTGTTANINAALDGLSFSPTANYSGSAGLQISTNDLGNTGVGGARTATSTVAISISHINRPPVNSVPGGQTTVENTPVLFSNGNGNAISISDPDAGNSPVQVTLNATNGALTLSRTTGLTFSTGTGAGDTTMVFTGTITRINAALNGLSFAPTANYNGPAGLQITTNDLGNTGVGGALSATDSVAITVNHVNQPPVNTVPGGQTTVENTPVVFSTGNGNAISVGDPDAGTSPLQVTLSAANGTLTLGQTSGLTFSTGTGSNNGTMTFTGTIANINAALDGLSFSPTANYNGAAAVQITTNDLGNTGVGGAQSATSTVAITVNHVDLPPANTVPGGQTTVQGTPLLFSAANGNAISIGDPDAGSNPVQVTLTATNGTLNLGQSSGLTMVAGGNGTGLLQFTGTIANINAALDGLRFSPTANYSGQASVQITTNDLGNTGVGGPLTATSLVNITVQHINQAPAVSLPGQQFSQSLGLTFSAANGNAITVSDPDAANSPVQVTLAATNGTFNLLNGVNGLTLQGGSGMHSAFLVMTGTVANINQALNGLDFLASSQSGTLQVSVNDLGNTGVGGAQSASGAVTVVQVPLAMPNSFGSGTTDSGHAPLKPVAPPPTNVPAPYASAPPHAPLPDGHHARAGNHAQAGGTDGLVLVRGDRGSGHLVTDESATWDYSSDAHPLTEVGLRAHGEFDASWLWNQIDALAEDVSGDFLSKLSVGNVAMFSAVFSAGYLVWFLRAGTLAASALSSVPAWGGFDPLPVLDSWERDTSQEQDTDEEAELLDSVLG